MPCSVVPRSLPISRLVRPSQTRVATCVSFGVNRSRGIIFHLRLLECGGSEPHPLAPLPNSSAQKKRAPMLLHGARADTQLPGDFLVAATLDQQIEHLLISRRNFDSVDIHHNIHHSGSPSLSHSFVIF